MCKSTALLEQFYEDFVNQAELYQLAPFKIASVAKCDFTKIKICKLIGFVEIIQAIKTKNAF